MSVPAEVLERGELGFGGGVDGFDKSVTITVPANHDLDDCLAGAAEAYIAEHGQLKGYDLDPRWADEDRELVALSVPRWHYEAISDTSGT